MSHNILVVEDNPDNTTLVAWALEDAGYEFSCVASAEHAFELLEEHLFDLVLMDISLPGMDGKEATNQLRRDSRFISLPIIAVTAHAIAEEERQIRSCGVDDMLTKPLDTTQLLSTIQTYLSPGENHGEDTRC